MLVAVAHLQYQPNLASQPCQFWVQWWQGGMVLFLLFAIHEGGTCLVSLSSHHMTSTLPFFACKAATGI